VLCEGVQQVNFFESQAEVRKELPDIMNQREDIFVDLKK